MIEHLSIQQFVEILEHNKGNDRDRDIWVLHEEGSAEIIPDQSIAELQNPQTWPAYICRAGAVNAHVSADGLYAALDHVNWAIGLTTSMRHPVKAMASLTRSAITSGYRAIRGSKTTS